MAVDYTLSGHALEGHWNRRECTIEPCVQGGFVIIDHSIQSTVATAPTRQELEHFLGHNGIPGDGEGSCYDPSEYRPADYWIRPLGGDSSQ